MAKRANITRVRGDTYAEVITVTNEAGVAQDITGATFKLTVSEDSAPDVANNLFQITGAIVLAAAGTVSFTPSTGDSNNFGEFFYDVQMTLAGVVTTLTEGRYNVTQDITKP